MATPIRLCFLINRLGGLSSRFCRISGCFPVRHYTIEPPEWMGGKYRIELPDKYEFPTRTKTFEERMKELSDEEEEEKIPRINIGANYEIKLPKERNELLAISLANRKNKNLEQAARLDKLEVPMDEVRVEKMSRMGPIIIHRVADHYGIYKDLFGNGFFYPIVPLHVAFNNNDNDDLITPVYFGNRIPPSECRETPMVSYDAEAEGSDDNVKNKKKLWTLLLTAPDSHLTNSNSEYVHWLVGNIEGDSVVTGETLVDYLQPMPANGTGFHRFVFILFEQNDRIDYSAAKLPQPCVNLDERSFRTQEFFEKHRAQLVPKGLSFFQSEWDASVRHAFHKTLDMEEPTYEYIYPPPYHPIPKKYPHREPFNRYFDRYRDRKDLAEEVLRIKLKDVSPFEKRREPEKYPLIHKPKTYKPTWLRQKEELMHRRLEQFKDLN